MFPCKYSQFEGPLFQPLTSRILLIPVAAQTSKPFDGVIQDARGVPRERQDSVAPIIQKFPSKDCLSKQWTLLHRP